MWQRVAFRALPFILLWSSAPNYNSKGQFRLARTLVDPVFISKSLFPILRKAVPSSSPGNIIWFLESISKGNKSVYSPSNLMGDLQGMQMSVDIIINQGRIWKEARLFQFLNVSCTIASNAGGKGYKRRHTCVLLLKELSRGNTQISQTERKKTNRTEPGSCSCNFLWPDCQIIKKKEKKKESHLRIFSAREWR